MILHSMTATFGCLNHATLELQGGMNVIVAPNEAGKSTWCAFLRVMLYGLNTRSRDKKGELGEKNRYRPWSGAPMEGLLDLSHQGKRILLRRTSHEGQPMGTFSAVYKDSGHPVPGMTGENAGELLLGVGREVFERTAFIRQTHLPVGESRELEQRIASLVTTGTEERSWSQAEESLKQWQRSRRYHKNGKLFELEEEETSLQERLGQLAHLHQEHLLLQEESAQLHSRLRVLRQSENSRNREAEQESQLRWAQAAAQLDAAQLQLQALEAQEQEEADQDLEVLEEEIAQREKDIRTRGQALFFFSILALLLAGFLVLASILPFIETNLSLAGPTSAIIFTGLVVILGHVLRSQMDKRDYEELDLLQEDLEAAQRSLEERDLEWERAIAREKSARQVFELLGMQQAGLPARSPETLELEQRLVQKERELALLTGRLQELGDPVLLEAELEQNRREQQRLQQEYDAITLAITALNDAERQLRVRFSPGLNDHTAAYFSALTGGAYEKVNLDRDFSAKTEQAGTLALHSASYLSQGALDQLYLALRLALVELVLPRAQSCPLFLDDALASFDDHRCKKALELLCDIASSRQILLFSCHRREATFLSDDPTVYRQQLTKA